MSNEEKKEAVVRVTVTEDSEEWNVKLDLESGDADLMLDLSTVITRGSQNRNTQAEYIFEDNEI